MMIQEGTQAPDFTLKDQNNQDVRLSSFRGSKNVLIVFYPLAFTGTCQGELTGLRDGFGQLRRAERRTRCIEHQRAHG